jgi:hypothetical protein
MAMAEKWRKPSPPSNVSGVRVALGEVVKSIVPMYAVPDERISA